MRPPPPPHGQGDSSERFTRHVFAASILGLFPLAWASIDEANAPALRALLLDRGTVSGVELPQSPPPRGRHTGPRGAAGDRGRPRRAMLPADFWLIDGTDVGKQLMPRSKLGNRSWSERQVEPRHRH